MPHTVEALRARPRPPAELTRLVTAGWPEFIFHDQDARRHIGRVRALFGDLELVLLDGDELVAAGWAVPLRWTGRADDLPAGYPDTLARALADHAHGDQPDTLAILAAQVRPDRQRRGVAGELLTALCALAGPTGCSRVICPVRPTHKVHYPLTPIERYQHWTRADGAPFDPWLRTHWRLGARVLAPAPHSQMVTGTVEQWQRWTGMAFPDSGQYVIPGGLAPLRVDRAADRGSYVEPNIWVRHR